MNVLVVDDGSTLCGYDCREVLKVEEGCGGDGAREPGGFLVRMGRTGTRKEIRCREIVGFCTISARDIRPLPPALRERLHGEIPWAVGITERGMCLLF
jgi:hypothetical protein